MNSWYDNYYREAYEKYSKDELIGFIIKLQHMHNNHVLQNYILKTMTENPINMNITTKEKAVDWINKYFSNEIDIGVLVWEIEKLAPELNDTDLTLGLWRHCRNDKVVVFALANIGVANFVTKYSKHKDNHNLDLLGVVFSILIVQVKNDGISYDEHFKTDEFSGMIVNAWKESWGADWEKLMTAGRREVKALPFYQPIADKYIFGK